MESAKQTDIHSEEATAYNRVSILDLMESAKQTVTGRTQRKKRKIVSILDLMESAKQTILCDLRVNSFIPRFKP